MNPTKQLTAGACAGMASVVACHPMDTIRTRLQTSKQFQGSALQCLRSTVTKEGVRGLYKGAFAPFVAQGVYKGVIFGVNSTLTQALSREGQPLSLWQKALCGATAGACNTLVVTPVELVRNRLQVQYQGKAQYSGTVDCIRQIVRQGGVVGLLDG